MERSNQIDRFPNDEIGEKKHVTLVEKQKQMNEQPNEIYWINEISNYRMKRIIELTNRNKKNAIKRT